VDGHEAGEIAYMLVNGQGKRMNEVRRKARAGQEVRLVDVPADTESGFDLLENLYHFERARIFADRLRQAASKFYSTPIRGYLEKITVHLDDELVATIKKAITDFVQEVCLFRLTVR